MKSCLEIPLAVHPTRSETKLRQTSGSRSRHGPSAQLTEDSAACWVTPLPFSHSIALIPALIFRSLRSCEKLHANREKKKFMVVQNSFVYKHKREWNFFTFAKRGGFGSRHLFACLWAKWLKKVMSRFYYSFQEMLIMEQEWCNVGDFPISGGTLTFDFLDSGIFWRILCLLGRGLWCLSAFLVSLKFVYVNILSQWGVFSSSFNEGAETTKPGESDPSPEVFTLTGDPWYSAENHNRLKIPKKL